MPSIEQRRRPDGSEFWLARYRHPISGGETARRMPSAEEATAFLNSIGQPLRRRSGKPARTAEELRVLVKDRSTVDQESECWLWTGAIGSEGYGRLNWKVDGRVEHGAHRISYIIHVGPIAQGKVIDHLCRVRSCVNPDHLEVVTQRENVLRSPIAPGALNAAKSRCVRGHEFTTENTQVVHNPGGRKTTERRCKACYQARRRAKKEAAA